jgi:hypothetical protein
MINQTSESGHLLAYREESETVRSFYRKLQ